MFTKIDITTEYSMSLLLNALEAFNKYDKRDLIFGRLSTVKNQCKIISSNIIIRNSQYFKPQKY